MIITGNGQGGSTTPGAVTSVANSDGTLTVSPGTGAVVASLALAHANTWTGLQTFNNVNGIKIENTITGSAITLKTGGTLPVTWTLPTTTGGAGAFLINNGSNVSSWTQSTDTAVAGGFTASGISLGFQSATGFSILGLEGVGVYNNYMLASDDTSFPLHIQGFSGTQSANLFEIQNHGGIGGGVVLHVDPSGNFFAQDSTLINTQVNNLTVTGTVSLPTGGTNTITGTETLTLGQVIVSTTAVTANSHVMVTYNSPKPGVTGILYCEETNIIPGTSFTIQSTDTTDSASTVNWVLFN